MALIFLKNHNLFLIFSQELTKAAFLLLNPFPITKPMDKVSLLQKQSPESSL